MKKIMFFFFFFSYLWVNANEGMWILSLINKKYEDLKKQGFRLTADDIYNVNKASLKDAIVGLSNNDYPLGFFCSASLVSSQGLVFTNHHCGYESIQQHSTVEHNYLADGFWAATLKDELPNENLCASILVRIDDVTSQILDGINEKMSISERAKKIEVASKKIEKQFPSDDGYHYQVVDMFEGNQYLLFVYQTFYDVRLVGAPPSSIGKFGGDTDNWMWTRHTGDFSVFRIYTDASGKPAPFSQSNIPYVPKRHLNVSLKGFNKGDFSMTIGFPGQTNRYMTSFAVQNEIDIIAPSVIKIREEKLRIIDEGMKKSEKTKIQYASKYSECSNYYKYYQGELMQLQHNKVVDKKKANENKFETWIKQNPERNELYKNVLPTIANYYKNQKATITANQYLNEAMFQGSELLSFPFHAFSLYSALTTNTPFDSLKQDIEVLKQDGDKFYKDFDPEIDKKLFIEMLTLYTQNVNEQYQLDVMQTIKKKYKGDVAKFADKAYASSIFASQEKFNKFLEKPTEKVLGKDMFFKIAQDLLMHYWMLSLNEDSLKSAERLWIKAQMEIYPDSIFYPDANSTIRLSYGKVNDYDPKDAVHYDYYTTIDGIMEKKDNTNDEFVVPPRLEELYKQKDYGVYANSNHTLPVCFLTTNDITGGNSGSAVMDADGNLIGLAFDGNWEAMSGDINYESTFQRTICVDIRYVMFIIDKYANDQRLVSEINTIK